MLAGNAAEGLAGEIADAIPPVRKQQARVHSDSHPASQMVSVDPSFEERPAPTNTYVRWPRKCQELAKPHR
jgi:hypothetical protein